MEITKEQREQAWMLLGDAAKDMDAPTLLSAALTFGVTAVEMNAELDTKVTELSASVTDQPEQPKAMELSAAVRKLAGDGIAAKVNAVADKLKWTTASRKVMADFYASDDVQLSAADEDSPHMKLLDLLGSLEVSTLNGQEKTNAQVDEIHLSRAGVSHDKTPDIIKRRDAFLDSIRTKTVK